MNHAGLIRVPVHTAERMRAILAAVRRMSRQMAGSRI